LSGILSEDVHWKNLIKQLPNGNTLEGAKEFMKEMLYITDLKNFPKPSIPEATIIVSAKFDSYVPQAGEILHSYWPGSELRQLNAGHVTSLFLHSDAFVTAIIDAIQRLKYILSK
jgi:hypothetical protein